MLDTRRATAIKKAIELDGPAKVRRVEWGTYVIESASRPGLSHVVTGKRTDDLECDCEAGSLGKPCWHAASVMVRRMEENAGVRVLGPAPAKPLPPMRRV